MSAHIPSWSCGYNRVTLASFTNFTTHGNILHSLLFVPSPGFLVKDLQIFPSVQECNCQHSKSCALTSGNVRHVATASSRTPSSVSSSATKDTAEGPKPPSACLVQISRQWRLESRAAVARSMMRAAAVQTLRTSFTTASHRLRNFGGAGCPLCRRSC